MLLFAPNMHLYSKVYAPLLRPSPKTVMSEAGMVNVLLLCANTPYYHAGVDQ